MVFFDTQLSDFSGHEVNQITVEELKATNLTGTGHGVAINC